MKPANELLREYYENSGLQIKQIVAEFGNIISHTTFSKYLNQHSTPQLHTRIAIAKFTKEYVPVSAWPPFYVKPRVPLKDKFEAVVVKTEPTIPKEPREKYDFSDQDIDPSMIPKNGFTPTATYAEWQYNGGSSNMLLDAV